LHQVIDLGGDHLVELGSQAPFRAAMTAPDALTIEAGGAHWCLEEEALRGVWLELQSGVVTKNLAGWTARDAGPQMVTLLSLLPGVRPIEIQRRGVADPELAIERIPGWQGLSPVVLPPGQTVLGWH
jgi:hypothetical protein